MNSHFHPFRTTFNFISVFTFPPRKICHPKNIWDHLSQPFIHWHAAILRIFKEVHDNFERKFALQKRIKWTPNREMNSWNGYFVTAISKAFDVQSFNLYNLIGLNDICYNLHLTSSYLTCIWRWNNPLFIGTSKQIQSKHNFISRLRNKMVSLYST